MTKKLICFPFIDGNLQEWSWNNLTDSEREQVNIEMKPVPEKSVEEPTKKTNTGEKPKRGRKKKSE